MLTHLSIENYVIIDKAEIDFRSGFTVITGETGAGKSILLGALSLILGGRADLRMMHNPERKCVIEGLFNVSSMSMMRAFFEQNELDYESEVCVRRELSPQGKSRAFINDTPVTLDVLKAFGEQMVDIHSQHDTLLLKENNFQLQIIDGFAQTSELLSEYKHIYAQHSSVKKHLDRLKEEAAEKQKNRDYNQFLFDELQSLALVDGEQQKLEEELAVLQHAEEIKRVLCTVLAMLEREETNVLSALDSATAELHNIERYNAQIEELSNRIRSVGIELKDVAGDLSSLEDDIEYDPARIEEITARLDDIYRLQKKHNVDSVAELLQIMQQLSDQLVASDSAQTEIENAEKELALLSEQLQHCAARLSEKRLSVTAAIEEQLISVLAQLGMADSQFKIEHTPTQPSPTGADSFRFLFTANQGTALRELAKAASGGELSRVMLAIKSLIRKADVLPTIIFDEIDTGISGDIAGKAAAIMQQMSRTMQVIAITHLPQPAAKADNHLYVYKTNVNNQTLTNIKPLSTDERIGEIAQMISNGTPTPAALQAAKDLLNHN